MPSNLHTSVLTTGFVVPAILLGLFCGGRLVLRVDNITLGYSLTYRGPAGASSFATVQNAFTITGSAA